MDNVVVNGQKNTEAPNRTWGQWIDGMLTGNKSDDPRGAGQIVADTIFGADKVDTAARTLTGVGVVDLAGGALGVPGLSVTRGFIEVGAGATGIVGRRIYLYLRKRADAKKAENGATPPAPTNAQIDAAVKKAAPSQAEEIDLTAEMKRVYCEDMGLAEDSWVQLAGKAGNNTLNKPDKKMWLGLQKIAAKNLNCEIVDAPVG